MWIVGFFIGFSLIKFLKFSMATIEKVAMAFGYHLLFDMKFVLLPFCCSSFHSVT